MLEASLSIRSLKMRLAAARQAAEYYAPRICTAAFNRLSTARAALDVATANINAASPQNALNRGFALVRTPAGSLARHAAELPPGSRLRITLADGSLNADVVP